MQAFRKVSGAAAALLVDDVNTDQIIPSAYLKDLQADLAQGLLAYLRRTPEGQVNPAFVLEKPQYQGAPILLVGRNFGCGSSREHAVWALRAYGIRCVIGPEPAEFFRENCLRNGVLPVALEPAAMQSLTERVLQADGHAPFTVDLEACEILGPEGYRCMFAIGAAEREALLEGLDDIGLTLRQLDAITAWEASAARDKPFVQSGVTQLFLR